MQSYFKTNPESFVESPEDMISKVARQKLIVEKVKKLSKLTKKLKKKREVIFFK